MSCTDSPTCNIRVPLIGLDRSALEKELLKLGEPKYRAKQLWHWLYHRGAKTFDDMTTLPKGLRELLDTNCTIQRPEIKRLQISEDESKKWLDKNYKRIFLIFENRDVAFFLIAPLFIPNLDSFVFVLVANFSIFSSLGLELSAFFIISVSLTSLVNIYF